MAELFNSLRCDGCGFPASAEHITQRLERLELATRYRPIHIHTLFIAMAPPLRPDDDFYRAPASNKFFETFLDALDIRSAAEQVQPASKQYHIDSRLLEFQRRGYYLAYLSECPLEPSTDVRDPRAAGDAEDLISALGPSMVRRIQLNYRPGHIVFLVKELDRLREILARAGAEGLLVLVEGQPLHLPLAGGAATDRFRAALRTMTTSGAATPAM